MQQHVGGYDLIRQIGSGGMGSVWEAVNGQGERVALKMLHPQIAFDPDARRRLQREAEVINKVRSRGVAQVLDLEVDSDQPFVVTELIDGPTLSKDVTQNGAWNREDLADLAEWLRRILTELHASGVVHRDIKPSNIMLSAQGPVLIDFGIAQMATDERVTATGLVTGTPGYLAPEVIAGSDPGPASDWWAWASVLVFCATGRQPFGNGPIEAVLARVSAGEVDLEGVEDQIRIPLLAALRPQPSLRATPEAVVAGLSADPQDFSPRQFSLTTVVPVAAAPVIPPPVDDSQDGEQDVEQEVVWRERYQPPSIKMAPFTGFLEAIVLASFICLTAGRLLPFLAVGLVALAVIGSFQRRLGHLRMSQGYKAKGDIRRVMHRLPRYVVRGVGALIGNVVVSAAVAFIGYFFAARFIPSPRPWPSLIQAVMFVDELTTQQYLVLWGVLTIAIMCGWWFPAGSNYRLGARYVHGLVIFHPSLRLLLVVVLIVTIVVLAYVMGVHQEVNDTVTKIIYHMGPAR